MVEKQTPGWVGIVNLTPDSFSDGGDYFAPGKAAAQMQRLIDDGATILDLGGESTRPGATPTPPEEEWRRLEPALRAGLQLAEQQPGVQVSVDTRHPATAEKALALGAHWINDVSGLRNPAMIHAVRHASCDLVMMHATTIPASSQDMLLEDLPVTQALMEWAEARLRTLELAGIARERVIFDPGIGFGKSEAQNFTLLQEIAQFKQLGVRLFVGHSRKRFLSRLHEGEAKARDLETAAISLHLAQQGVDYLRVHDVATNARVLKAFAACQGEV